MIIGTPQQRAKLLSPSIDFQGSVLTPSDSARNLGVTFDSNHSFTSHISSLCQSAFFQIRILRQIRPILDINTAIILANSLVSSRLDYCNSLLFNLPASSIDRLQRVQNSLARLVLPYFRRRDHITPALQKLHWLPIKQRIIFKIASLTYKIICTSQPAYLHDLIQPYAPAHDHVLRSSSKNLLQIPLIKSELGRRSFFFAAPTIWNSLPSKITTDPTLSSFPSFRKNLKTHLFPRQPPQLTFPLPFGILDMDLACLDLSPSALLISFAACWGVHEAAIGGEMDDKPYYITLHSLPDIYLHILV